MMWLDILVGFHAFRLHNHHPFPKDPNQEIKTKIHIQQPPPQYPLENTNHLLFLQPPPLLPLPPPPASMATG
ncbi:hypothetical protein L6452_12878 [Arctium lappa]|uniref:Uncharacterized protein n=1 Tax=Arctium lappa TaxID=4217 RepID=A0ACB9CGP5_ARCLA|nr:hypothetical protein L6452_12878 [Arctium lappa]